MFAMAINTARYAQGKTAVIEDRSSHRFVFATHTHKQIDHKITIASLTCFVQFHSSSIMFAHQRHNLIVQVLERHGSVSVRELPSLVSASPATVRRDLDFLAQRKCVVRAWGGVLHPDFAVGESSFVEKARTAVYAKVAIGQAAAAKIAGRVTIFVDSGSTTLEAARHLLLRPEVTIFTNSLPLLCLRSPIRCRLVALGGVVRQVSRALVGALAMDWMTHLEFDYALIGASGLEARNGASTTELLEAAIKKEAIERSRRTLLLADASKWNHPMAVRFAEWRQFDTFVTDVKLALGERRALSKAGVELVLVR
jgi:DeoR/GlpR family transcriptional regulator of sugar metabolism